MKVWLLNPYGQLPGEGWRDYRFTMIQRALADRGHVVTWWTAAFDHHTKTARAQTLTDRPVSDRATIRLVPVPTYAKNVSLRRLWFEVVFAWRVLRDGKKNGRPDVIVAADPPQPNGVAAVLLARHFRVPLVLDCLDLWPEAFDCPRWRVRRRVRFSQFFVACVHGRTRERPRRLRHAKRIDGIF